MTFMIKIENSTKEDLKNLSKVMDKIQDETVVYVEKLATELGISADQAFNIYYLRSRSRWTQSKEDELIQLMKEGKTPNIMEF